MTFIKSFRAKKSRINHERLLGIKKAYSQCIAITPGARLNFGTGDFSVAVFCNINDPSPNTLFSFRDNASGGLIELRIASTNMLRLINLRPTNSSTMQNVDFQFPDISSLNKTRSFVLVKKGTMIEIYINTIRLNPLNAFSLQATDEFNFADTQFNIGASTKDGINSLECQINNFIISSKAWSTDEIIQFHALGGAVPTTVHSYVLHYWPLTQKSYHNYESYAQSDPGDLIVNGDFASNDLTGWTNSVGTADASTGEAVWQSGTTVQLQQAQWNNTNAGLVKVTVKYDITQTITGSGAYFRYEGQLNNHSPAQTAEGSYEYVYYTRGNVTTVFKFINATGGAVDNLSVFVEKIPLVAWDVVEQYNYAKNAFSFYNEQGNDFGFQTTQTTVLTIVEDDNLTKITRGAGGTTYDRNAEIFNIPVDVSAGTINVEIEYEIISGDVNVTISGDTISSTQPLNFSGKIKETYVFNEASSTGNIILTLSILVGAEIDIYAIKVWQGNHYRSPLHARLNNFTDTEVGANSAGYPTSIIDAFSKKVSVNKGLYHKVTNSLNADWSNRLNRCEVSNFASTIASDSDFTVLLDFGYIQTYSDSELNRDTTFFMLGNFNTTGIAIYVQGTSLKIREQNITTQLGIFSNSPRAGKLLVALSYNSLNNTYSIKINMGGVVVETTHIGNGWSYDVNSSFSYGRPPTGVGSIIGVIWNQVLVFNNMKSDSELRQWIYGNLGYSDVPVLHHTYRLNEGEVSDGIIISDHSGNNNSGTLTFGYGEYSYIRERHSLLPEIISGLQFNNSLSQRRINIISPLVSSDTGEVTILHAFRINSFQSGNKYFFSANDGGIASTNNYLHIYRNGTSGQLFFAGRRANDTETITIVSENLDEILLKNGINILAFRVKHKLAEAFINGILIGSDLNAECPDISSFSQMRINAYTNNGYEASASYLHTAIYSRFLSKKEILKICDNSFINPLVDDSLVLMPDYQHPYDDSGVIKLNDLSSGDHTIVVENFNDIADVKSNFFSINSYR